MSNFGSLNAQFMNVMHSTSVNGVLIVYKGTKMNMYYLKLPWYIVKTLNIRKTSLKMTTILYTH